MAWWAVWGTTIPLSVTLLHIQHPKSLLFAIGTTKAFLPNTCNHLCIPRPSSPELGVQSSRAPEPADSVMHSAGAALACPISHSVGHGLTLLFPGSWLPAPGLLLTTGQHILWPLQTLPGLHVCPGLTSKDYKILNLLLACPCPWLSSSPSPAHKTHPEWPVSTIGKEATSHSSGVKGEAQYSYPIDPASLSLLPKVFPSALKKRVLTW